MDLEKQQTPKLARVDCKQVLAFPHLVGAMSPDHIVKRKTESSPLFLFLAIDFIPQQTDELLGVGIGSVRG